MCCPVLGVPLPGGTPAGGYSLPGVGTPGTPSLTWPGYPPVWTWLRYPPWPGGVPSQLDLAGVPPSWTWPRYPLWLDLARLPPPTWTWLGYPSPGCGTPRWTWLGYPPGWTWPGYPPSWIWLGYPPGLVGYPPRLDLAGVPSLWTDRQMDGWTETCQNITFARTTYAVGNKVAIRTNILPESEVCVFAPPSSSCVTSSLVTACKQKYLVCITYHAFYFRQIQFKC